MRIRGPSGQVYTWDDTLGAPTDDDIARMLTADLELIRALAGSLAGAHSVRTQSARTVNLEPTTSTTTSNHNPPDSGNVLHAKRPDGEGSVEGGDGLADAIMEIKEAELKGLTPAHALLHKILAVDDIEERDPADQASSGAQVGFIYAGARGRRSGAMRHVATGKETIADEDAIAPESEIVRAALDLGITPAEYRMIQKVRHADRLGMSIRDYLAAERQSRAS